jgi:hypothetical protein
MPAYWSQSPYRLLQTSPDRQLLVTDDFLRSYLDRPELALIPESCAAEHRLHQRLMDNPRAEISEADIAQMQDADIQANYGIWLRYRSKLLKASSLEAFYMSLFEGDGVDVPPLFISQLTQVFIQHILGEDAPPLELRMAELFFRTQVISIQEGGVVMAADALTIERSSKADEFGSIVDLLKRGTPASQWVDLDVLHEENASNYWARDSDFDFAVQLNYSQPTTRSFCSVLQKWINHFLGVEVKIKPLKEVSDPNWVWHVGLDASSTEILNALYNKEVVEEPDLARLLCLFRLEFINSTDTRPDFAGRNVYLGMAMNEKKELKLKPQNVLFNLPLARAS